MTLVREFHLALNLEAPEHPTIRVESDLVRLRMRLIREEFKEVMDELGLLVQPRSPDETVEILRRLLKELADLRYVTEGCAVSFGLPIDPAFEEVHRSNMSKLGTGGLPSLREDGKILKGPRYSPADMEQFIPPILDHTEED
jgi:predicted HAD superfamily Cof-like phosphohydrolase